MPLPPDGLSLADQARLSLIIIARNEAASLPWLFDRLAWFEGDRLLVDGQSTDDTARLAAAAGWRVVPDGGTGKGGAIRAGAEAATGDLLVFMDADGSHDPADIPALVAPLARGDADLVLGSRMRGGSDELYATAREVVRLLGSVVITLTINYRFGLRLTDYQNGFRAIRRDLLRSLGTRETTFTIEQEMVLKAIRRGARITEVPTHEYRRRFGRSQLRVRRVGWRFVWCLGRHLL